MNEVRVLAILREVAAVGSPYAWAVKSKPRTYCQERSNPVGRSSESYGSHCYA